MKYFKIKDSRINLSKIIGYSPREYNNNNIYINFIHSSSSTDICCGTEENRNEILKQLDEITLIKPNTLL
jgi:hypothetical protein